MLKLSLILLQILLASTFVFIPISRILGASTLQQALDLHIPLWLIWLANVIELSGAFLLLLGLRVPRCAMLGAGLIATSMLGATVAHVQAGNLFGEIPWTLIFLVSCLALIVTQRSLLSVNLKREMLT